MPLAWGMPFQRVFARPCGYATKSKRSSESHGLPDPWFGWFAGFHLGTKGLCEGRTAAIFLAALDEHCEGEIPEYVWRIRQTRIDKDSLASLRQHVAMTMHELSEGASGTTRKQDSHAKGSASHVTTGVTILGLATSAHMYQ